MSESEVVTKDHASGRFGKSTTWQRTYVRQAAGADLAVAIFRVIVAVGVRFGDAQKPLVELREKNGSMGYSSRSARIRASPPSAQSAAVYVTPNDVREYAKAIVELIDDEARRSQPSKVGRARVKDKLAWGYQARAYVGVYEGLTGGTGAA